MEIFSFDLMPGMGTSNCLFPFDWFGEGEPDMARSVKGSVSNYWSENMRWGQLTYMRNTMAGRNKPLKRETSSLRNRSEETSSPKGRAHFPKDTTLPNEGLLHLSHPQIRGNRVLFTHANPS